VAPAPLAPAAQPPAAQPEDNGSGASGFDLFQDIAPNTRALFGGN
jgi:hypothetical protein